MSINVILECPSKSKRYNIEITNDVTPFQLEQEFKEQFFNKDDSLKFYFQNQPLLQNKPLVEQNIVKGSVIIIKVVIPVKLNIPSLNKIYSIEIELDWTTIDLAKKLSELLQLRTEDIQFQLNQQALKSDIPLLKQEGVTPNCTIKVDIQQKGGRQP